MAAPNATRRPGGGVSAAVIHLDEQITIENSAATRTGQAVTLPTLADARARLVEVIWQRPAKPEPKVETDRQAEASAGAPAPAIRPRGSGAASGPCGGCCSPREAGHDRRG